MQYFGDLRVSLQILLLIWPLPPLCLYSEDSYIYLYNAVGWIWNQQSINTPPIRCVQIGVFRVTRQPKTNQPLHFNPLSVNNCSGFKFTY